MQVLLRVVQKQANVQQVRLLADTVIGRSLDCNLKIASTQVSRRHCRIAINGLGVYVEDLCSSNGTYLDGKRLLPNQLTYAPAGSQLVIGPATFVIDYRTSTVKQPELGAASPAVERRIDPSPEVETTNIPLAEVKAALTASAAGKSAEVGNGPAIQSRQAESGAPLIEEPPQRARSLFGLFRRDSKPASKSTPVPFLPTEPELRSEVAEESNDQLGPVDPPSSAEFTAVESAPVPVDAENPFRQFSQY